MVSLKEIVGEVTILVIVNSNRIFQQGVYSIPSSI